MYFIQRYIYTIMPSRFFAMQIRSFVASALTSIKHSLSQTAYSAIISTLTTPALFSHHAHPQHEQSYVVQNLQF